MRNKLLGGLGLVLVLGAVALPLSNLLSQPNPNHDPAELLGDGQTLDRLQPGLRTVTPIFQKKCIDCHSSLTHLPVYAQWPIAKQLITRDIEEGRRNFDLVKDVYQKDGVPSALTLAQLEAVVRSGEMPPRRYTLMHWNAALTEADQKALLGWIQDVRHSEAQKLGMAKPFWNEPVQPLPQTVAGLNPQAILLGERLYHEVRLSGDNTLSCASCHALNKGGTDQRRVSVGIRGQLGGINSPTTYNASFNVKQFWDGRAETLADQAKGPVANPIEMGATWKDVVAKLSQDPSYTRPFQQLYGQLTEDTVAQAIATYEESLVTPNSRFDRYLRGDATALNTQEQKGYALFKSVGCATCHAGPALGGGSFEKMGVKRNYFALRQKRKRGKLTEADNGRFNATKDPRDKHLFKVPLLRNIERTAPYFHDGSVESLEEAVKIMAEVQSGRTLSPQEAADITAFLKTLTGEYNGQAL